MNGHNTVEEHSRKVPTLQQSQNYSAWRPIWSNMKTVSFSKSKESGVKTHHWEVLILMLKADGYWQRERHSACVGVSSQLWHISYLPQLLLKVIEGAHGGLMNRARMSCGWRLNVGTPRRSQLWKHGGGGGDALDHVTLHMLSRYSLACIATLLLREHSLHI